MSKHPTKMIQEFSRLMIPVTSNEQANKTWRLHNTLRNTIPLEGGRECNNRRFQSFGIAKSAGGDLSHIINVNNVNRECTASPLIKTNFWSCYSDDPFCAEDDDN